ncbi:MAG: hypothetical protein CMP21_03815 [Rickettsiales bacterium]|nr:hypothetical protein [Rickettsiales bacterium]
MTLKLRASGQVKNQSVQLSNLVNVSSGSILGRSEDESGEGVMSALSGSDVRKIAELHNDDNVQFASASLTGALTASSKTLTGDLAAADANLSGDLNATGDVGGATATISGNSTIGGTLGVTSSLSAQSASITAAMSSATISTSSDASIGGDLTVSGNLTISGDSVQVNVATLQIEDSMLKIGKGNTSDTIDLGFYGLYNDGSDKYAGLFRDQSDSGKFKLFDGITSEPSTTVADVSGNKATLSATIEGNITFDNARTFSLSGDLSGSQTFDGSGNCEIDATIADDSIEFSMLGCEIDEDDMASNSASHVPTQQSVKTYSDSEISSFGQDDLEAKDMLMVDSTGSYVKVKEVKTYSLVSSDDESNDYVTVSTEIESEFKELSQVYLNGQKLRYSSDTGTSNDYWITATDSGATRYETALTASDAASKDFFGSGVGLSSDGLVLAVGASRWEGASPNNQQDQGGVYIYDWNSDNEEWDQRGSVITAPDAGNNDRFGASTSLNSDGTIMATGAMFWDDDETNQGAAYVFEYSGGSWSQKGSTLSHDNPTASDLFTHVSISGNGLVLSVGIYAYDGSTGTDQGAVYVYDWNASSNDWDERGNILLPSDPAATDYFGRDTSLSNDGSVLIVGSAAWEGDTTNQGAVYVYDWTDTDSDGTADAWVQRGNVLETAGSEAVNDYFGFSCQLNSDATIMAVSKYQLVNGGGDEGEVELYDWNSSTNSWDLRLTISNPYPATSGTKNQYGFGYKVSIDGDGDVLVISERGSGYNNFAGRVQTYSISTEATTDKINFNNGVISENDKLEISYIIKS